MPLPLLHMRAGIACISGMNPKLQRVTSVYQTYKAKQCVSKTKTADACFRQVREVEDFDVRTFECIGALAQLIKSIVEDLEAWSKWSKLWQVCNPYWCNDYDGLWYQFDINNIQWLLVRSFATFAGLVPVLLLPPVRLLLLSVPWPTLTWCPHRGMANFRTPLS